MKQKVQGFFQSFDMFAAPASLRARGSSTITRTGAGVISFVLFCYFTYIFVIGLYRIFTYESITTSQTFQKIPLTQIYAQNFMFGVGHPQIDPQLLAINFQIKVLIKSTLKGIIQNITMVPCDPEQWQKLGEDYQQQFNLHYLNRFVCPSQPQKLKLINSTIIGQARYFQVLIQPKTGQIQQFFNQYSAFRDIQTNKFNIFFLDSAVIPNQQDVVEYFVNINHFAYVSDMKQHKTLIRLSNFRTQTDYSVIPIYQSVQVREGVSISDAVLTQIDSMEFNQTSTFTFQLTNDLVIYNRKVGKVDEMFSYAGGLFALVIWCLAFFVASFNTHRYQLMVAQTTFNFDKDGNKVREKDFNFLKYIKYSIYTWVQHYFFVRLKWKDCQQIQATIAQANNQMDVTRLFRKLQFFEMALLHSTSQSQNMLVALTQPRSLQQVKEQRLILEYYFAIIRGQPAATVEDALDGHAIRFDNLNQSEIKLAQSQGLLQHMLHKKNKDVSLQPKQQIKQNLIMYLELHESVHMCDAIAEYPLALEQAKLVVLTDQLSRVQQKLTNYFLKLRPLMKQKIMKKIPLKIIHRLCLKSQQMKKKNIQMPPQQGVSG